MGDSKLTDVRMQALLQALEGGCTRRAAAGHAGIHHATFYRWIDDDATLRDAVEKAETKAESLFTAAVLKAIPDSWQAAAWWLERRHWRDYGRHERVEIDIRREAERLAAELDGVTADQLIAEAEAIAKGRR